MNLQTLPTSELKKKNREREIKGLVEAYKGLGIKEGVIFTYDEEGRESVLGSKVPQAYYGKGYLTLLNVQIREQKC